MKKQSLLSVTSAILAASLSVVACSSNNSSTSTGDGGGSTTGNPAPPTLGAQVDRMGRPAINTALNHGFDGNTATAGSAKDAYNADTTVANWVTNYQGQFEANLAILDSLNTGASPDGGGGCGDQPFYSATVDGGGAYGTLAGVLASDELWLNTAGTTCTTYLGVELNATMVVANTDCGGRRISDDVIQTTYSVVSGVGLTGFGSGVTAVAAKTSGTTFPYLAAPL